MPGNRASDQQEVLLLIHVHHLQVLHRHALDAVMARHLLVGVHPARGLSLPDRARMAAILMRSVSLPKSGETPAFDNALESATLGSTDDIHQLPLGEEVH